MKASSRLTIVAPLASAMALFALSAQAQVDNVPQQPQRPAAQAPKAPPRAAVQGPRSADAVPGRPPGAGAGRGAPAADARFYRGTPSARVYGGNPYRGRVAWEGGRWRHERHGGRDGWWWDVGGVWYYYPQPVDGPPTYISDDYADDIPAAAYGPPPGAYPPPPVAYAPPPPPPEDPNPAAGAIGGAVIGGLLGGLLTGHASGAAAGALVGGTTGAIVGATAASRPGYYFSQGNCYYRYPSGQYALVDQRACY